MTETTEQTNNNMSEELPPQHHADEDASFTKVYYHVDDELTPYCSTVHVPPDKITLADFKAVLSRSNFKFYCKSIDTDLKTEVKLEIRDEKERLGRSANGRIELFLLTAEGSSLSDGSGGHKKAPGLPLPPPSKLPAFVEAVAKFDQSVASTDSESAVSGLPNLPKHPFKGALNRRTLQPNYRPSGYRNRRVVAENDSTLTSETDTRMVDSEDDRVSTSTDITSVSRQQQNLYRRRRTRKFKYRQPSRASSFSSITESSMSLNIITVTLNMDTVNFLGISIVGQSSQRGDGGIYVANIMKGGAVALDGRIETGDMILQVNDVSFENLTNDEAVAVLKEAVCRKGPIKLVVAKCWDSGPKSCFTIPRQKEEPVRPIDTLAWIHHTNQMRAMPSILEGSEGAPTPIPGQQQQHNRPPSGGTAISTNSGSGHDAHHGHFDHLDKDMDRMCIVKAMAMPNSGLDIRNRTWLKIPIPMSFIGSELVEWLLERVHGLRDKKDARKYASLLLKEGYIKHVVKKVTFTEQCYYVFGDICADFARMRMVGPEVPPSELGSVGPPPQQFVTNHPMPLWPQAPTAPSMVSGYASMPMSPFPQQQQLGTLPTAPIGSIPGVASHSQASGGSNGSSGSDNKRKGCRPSSAPVKPRLEELPHDLASSRQSFRNAMNNPCEFFVDNL